MGLSIRAAMTGQHKLKDHATISSRHLRRQLAGTRHVICTWLVMTTSSSVTVAWSHVVSGSSLS